MSGAEVRLARESDRSGILELVIAAHGRAHAEDVEKLWNWRWRDDPRLKEPGYYGLLGAWRGRVLASVSWLPAGLLRHGVPFDASWGVDAAVHFGWLRESLRESRAEDKAERRTRESRGKKSIMEDLLTHPDSPRFQVAKNLTERMQIVAKRVGYEPGAGSGYLMRNLSVTPRIKRVVGGVLAPVVAWLPDRLIGRFPAGLDGATRYEGDFDESFDELWQEVSPEYPVISLRDSRTLNWRYRHHPLQDYITLVYRSGGHLKGYVVVATLPKRGRPRGRIVDLLTRRGDQETTVRLLTGALRELLRQRVARVDCYIGEEDQATSGRQMGFHRRSTSTPLLVIGEIGDHPYLTAGDGDGS